MIFYLFLINFYFFFVDSSPPPIINLPLGVIEGTTDFSRTGWNFYKFEGVPYAQPPVGQNRFAEPIPITQWTGIIKANTLYKCMQYKQFPLPGEDPVVGDEDCLYLNIYTPNLQPDANLDVIVYIHGGAFMFNYGGLYQPHYQMDRNIISITINYRLGILGFLSTESDEVPGNNGIKDQILALKWIKDNIKYFGGNPDSITIFGNSAGGASVHLHQLIPKSRGLFQKAVSQSGVALDPWVIMENPLEKTKRIAEAVGCNNSSEILSCLRLRSGRQITETVKLFQPWLYNPFSPFGVVVDSSWASDPLLPDHPYKLLQNKKIVNDVPWIVSMVSSEGLYPAADFYNETRLKTIDDQWNELLPFLLDFNYTVELSEQNAVSEQIRDFYFKNESITRENYMTLVQIFSDRHFFADLDIASRLHAAGANSSVYSYYFGYRGKFSRSDPIIGDNIDRGACHSDDNSYFYKTVMDTTTTPQDEAVIEMFLDMFVGFAKTGIPKVSIEWEPVSKNGDKLQFLEIMSATNIKMSSNENLGNRRLWDDLPIKENGKLFEIN